MFLLPGNPVSCLCAYDLFAGRAVRRLGGRSPEPYRSELLPLAAKIASAVGRVDYARVRIVDGRAEPLAVERGVAPEHHDAGRRLRLVPRDSEGYPAGRW